jgi:HAD superfamily hydrolase (TIGR01509 family)
LVPGVREFLQRHAGQPVGLATNAEPANVDFILDRGGLRAYFRVVVDGHQVQHPKPHPEIYLRAAGLLSVAPRNCIVFEDSFSGVEAARAAGARIVGVRTTHRELPGADLVIDDFRDPQLGQLEAWLRAQVPDAP